MNRFRRHVLEVASVSLGLIAAGSGSIAQWSSACAGGTVTMTGQQWGDLVRSYFPGYTGHRPRLQHWHGTADMTLNYKNLAEDISASIRRAVRSGRPPRAPVVWAARAAPAARGQPGAQPVARVAWAVSTDGAEAVAAAAPVARAEAAEAPAGPPAQGPRAGKVVPRRLVSRHPEKVPAPAAAAPWEIARVALAPRLLFSFSVCWPCCSLVREDRGDKAGISVPGRSIAACDSSGRPSNGSSMEKARQPVEARRDNYKEPGPHLL
jgi:hypothetical protein